MITTLSTVIAPYATPIDSLFFALVFLTLLSTVFAFLLFTNRIFDQNRIRGLLAMLAGFVAIVSLSAVIFTWVHSRSIQPIVFDHDKLTIGSSQLAYRQIKNSYLKPLVQKSRYSPELNTDTALIYVIEMRDGRSHLLSNDNYDLQAVRAEMKLRLK